ncbi:MAG: cell wall hydrolase [Lachnospiraceae bacterium]|nr:cell wall hydrolase [Lachnospiraceae bacterium]
MDKNRKCMEVFALLGLTLMISITAVLTNDTAIVQSATLEQGTTMQAGVASAIDNTLALAAIPSSEAADNVIAGVSGVVGDYEETVYVERGEVDVVAASGEEEEPESEWSDKLMADVDKEMNVRAEANAESSIVGTLHKGDLATVLEDQGEWIKITSGNVEGYVKSDYCVTGEEAYDYAMENCHTTATVLTNGLRIRKDMSTESGVVKTLAENDAILVDTGAEVEDGWVAVIYNKETYYVSAEYVDVALSTGTALTVEEEAEIARREAEAAAAAKAKQTESAGTVTGSALAANVDEVTLLAALIQCEAGNQSYDCQLAVGAVVVNRVKSPSYPNTLVEVIYQKSQFGPASNGALAKRLNKSISETAMAAASAALNGDSNVGGACSFKLTKSGHEGIAIDALVFY